MVDIGSVFLYTKNEGKVLKMFKLKKLPPNYNFDTIEILRQLSLSHKALAELKGYSEVVPNKNILINAAMINEAKNSSEIENIVTTHDEIYKALSTNKGTLASKEVINYRSALWMGYELIRENGFLSTNMIVKIQKAIENSEAGIRTTPGTTLKNERTGEVVYMPPQSHSEIIDLMNNLEKYINNDHEIDDLIKLAIIHYQFESIHPFYDGNGRTGRVINVLYLTLKDLLDSPILYMSKYINNHKQVYYKVLQNVRDKNDFESLVLFKLKAIEETSVSTLNLLKQINSLIDEAANEIKEKLPKIYSKELIEVLFYEFYTKIVYVQEKLNVSRRTASTYLIQLEEAGFLTSKMEGREKIYLNNKLFELIKKADF